MVALASLAGHSVLAVVGADPCHGSSRTEVCPVESMDTSLEQEETCSLYLAPSSIPNAGLGIYTAVNLPYGATVGDDFFIPIKDHLKTYPYRGQQRFLSWLRYVWPKEIDAFYPTYDAPVFPSIPSSFFMEGGLNAARGTNFRDGKERVSAFSPGIASLANSDRHFANIETVDPGRRRATPTDAAFTPHHGVTFRVTQTIPAGTELLLDYGEEWHNRYQKRIRSRTDFKSKEEWNAYLMESFDDEEDMMQGDKKKRRDEDEVRREIKSVMEEMRSVEKDDDNEAKSVAGEVDAEEEYEDEEDSEDEGGYEDEQDSQDEGDDEVVGAPKMDETMPPVDPTKIEWLQKNGLCVDNIQAGPSTLPDTGRGAFAKKFIPKGSLIAPAPLVVLKREDLVIFQANLNVDIDEDVLNFDKVEGHELLLNYCFGHKDSSLLLLPYSPIVNFINHDSMAPNAEIRWAEKPMLGDPEDWLNLHPLDVLDQSGQLMMEFIALRDIGPGEEIFINYGREWEDAWSKHEAKRELTSSGAFRHEIGVPSGFFPNGWKVKSLNYELAPRNAPLKPGEVVQMRWAHNGKPVTENAYFVGLPRDFSVRTREYSDLLGATALYKQLLKTRVLGSNEWFQFDGDGGKWTFSNYAGNDVYDIGPWDEASRVSWLRFLGQNDFDTVLDGIGRYFGFEHLTCYFNFFVGLAKSGKTNTMHADLYGTGNAGFNILWPLLLVNGSKPELMIQSDDANIVIPVNYEYDTAIALGDYGYHMTNPINYGDTGDMRIVVGTYCSQIDESNSLIHKYLNAGDEPIPFLGELDHIFNEYHWGQGHSLPK